MRILVDTNVIVDYILKRESFYEDARKIFELCKDERLLGAVSSQSIADTFYILRKFFSVAERRMILLNVCNIFHIESVDRNKIVAALRDEDFSDFEDCLQVQYAKSFRAGYIITRNVKDFAASVIPAISPREFSYVLQSL